MNETNNFSESAINRGERKTALKIRFIKLTSALVLEVLERDNESLGADRRRDASDDPLGIFGLPRKTAILDLPFSEAQARLNAFADGNAFHGITKPVKRIEYDAEANGSRFYYEGGASPLFPATTAERLKNILGNDFEIYEPKARFAFEWRKISANDVTKPAIYDSERQGDYENGYREGVDAMIYMFNKKSPFPEVWEFEMKEAN